MGVRSQITEVTCEEGWSYVAEWTGTPLSAVLESSGVRPTARYLVYYSTDPEWWESIDIDEALHPQTLLAWGMNGSALPVSFGGPLRLRVPRQLGYKSVKFVDRLVLTDTLDGFGNGTGAIGGERRLCVVRGDLSQRMTHASRPNRRGSTAMSPSETKLSKCWHPVAYARELSADSPHGAKLLEEHLVLWRTADGTPHAMRDLCIHRGTALSLGWIKDDCIVCPYHAWQYDAGGACVKIPQKEGLSIPSKARTVTYRCQERYGLIWVALDEPLYPLPEIPELTNGEWKVVETGPFEWKSDASRQVENFTDFGHFPWVHPGLLGDPERPVVPPYERRDP